MRDIKETIKELDDTETIPSLEFIEKLFDVFCLVQDCLTALEPIKSDLLSKRNKFLETFLNIYIAYFDQENREKAKSLILDRFSERNRKQFNKYSQVLINQDLVLLCSTFEIFLVKSLSLVLSKSQR
jgi:formate dehydrogenase maturation protein FdhE